MTNPHLQGSSIVLFDQWTQKSDQGRLHLQTRRYDLDRRLGNENGKFTYKGHNFSHSAEEVRMEHFTLIAMLRTVTGTMVPSNINLDWVMDSWRLASTFDNFTLADTRPSLTNLYVPLSENCFRLCHITPGAWEDSITCKVVTQDMDKAVDYVCLSYVWGDTNRRTAIKLDGLYTPVGQNLLLAFRQLRWHGVAGAVWIDVLCINQADFDEKSIQVANMAKIYSRASRVIVSLTNAEAGLGKLQLVGTYMISSSTAVLDAFTFIRALAKTRELDRLSMRH